MHRKRNIVLLILTLVALLGLSAQVYSSPLFLKFRYGNTVDRIGFSDPVFQDWTQNLVHKWLGIGRQNYYVNYENFSSGAYGYSGWYSPYSIWGR